MEERVVAGIILAAGFGERFGGDKLLHELHGKPIVLHCLDACLDSRLATIRVVVGADNRLESILQRPAPDSRVTLIRNNDPRRGQMSSLKKGLERLPDDCDAAMVFLADMPFVTSEIVNELIDTFHTTKAIVIPSHNGHLGHPRILPRRLFPAFMRLGDDEKGLRVIDRFRDDIVTVEVEDGRFLTDIDRIEDLDNSGR